MTRVDFYVLPDHGRANAARFACRLTEKAYKLSHRVFIHTAGKAEAESLDDLLWTFRDRSFVPHEIVGATAESPPEVLIGYEQEPGEKFSELLINLAPAVPLFFSRFDRVAELVTGDDDSRLAGRDRFRFYRDRGYDIKTHNMG